MAAADTMTISRATRLHRFVTGLWLAFASLCVVVNVVLVAATVVIGDSEGTANPAVGYVYLLSLGVTVVASFTVTQRSRVELTGRGFRVVPVVGESFELNWAQVVSISVGKLRPGWLLWLSQWSVVEVQLTNGETVALGPSQRHSGVDATQICDELRAALRSHQSTPPPDGPFLPRVYRPSRLERVYSTLFLFIGVFFLLGIVMVPASSLLSASVVRVFSSSLGGAPIGPFFGVLIWIVLIAVYLASRRERLVVTRDGLEIYRFTGQPMRLPWTAIEAFAVQTTFPFRTQYGAAPWQIVVANLRDGSSVMLTPTERNGRTSADVELMRDQLAADLDLIRPGRDARASTTPVTVDRSDPAHVPGAATGNGPNRSVSFRGAVAVVVSVLLFGFLQLAAGGQLSPMTLTDAVPSRVFFAVTFALSLLVPALALGIGALGAEGGLRRYQPKAVAFAALQRSRPHNRAFHNLPGSEYAPVAGSIELGLLLLTVVALSGWLGAAITRNDWAYAVGLLVALMGWLALAAVWTRALWQMARFRLAPETLPQPGSA